MQRRLYAVAAVAALSPLTGCGHPKYDAFEVTDHENPALTFRFSAADATSASPVIISVPGRELTPGDGSHRLSLQKYWVATHAPKGASFVAFGSAMCNVKRQGEFPGCDVMIVKAPGRDEQLEYYFYDGNWPEFKKLGGAD